MKPPLALFTSLVWMLLAGSALAEGSKLEEAKRAFGAGDQAYAAGQYLAAARAYENAYELHPLPSITFSMAQAYRRHYFEDADVRWLEMAQALYRRYLAEQPSGGRRDHAITHLGSIELLLAARANPDRPQQEEKRAAPTEVLISSATPRASASIDGAVPHEVPVVQRVSPGKHRVKLTAPGFFEAELDALAVDGRLTIVPVDLKARPGSLRIVASDGAGVSVDGQLVARTPMAAPFELPAGRHVVSVSARGRRPVSRSLNVARGETHTWRVDLEPSGQRVVAQWTLAGAGAFALAGGAMAVLALVAEGEAEDARSVDGRAMRPDEAARSNDALERRDRYRTLSLASLGVSAAAGATGALLFFFDDPAAPPARNHGGAYGAGYRGRF